MKKQHFRFGDLFVAHVVVSLAVFGTAAGVYAQGSSTPPQRDMSNAERNVRSMEIGASTPRDAKTVLGEVNDDFARIHVLNDEIKSASSSNGPLNYKSLSDTSVELKKRATRLRLNLTGLPKKEGDEKPRKESVPLDETQMKALLSSLNTVISSFLTNPVFSDMGTLDNQLALKARHDLENLIELNEVVKKGADKLGKHADNRVNPKTNSPNE
jgi:HAMP domain-containing protein